MRTANALVASHSTHGDHSHAARWRSHKSIVAVYVLILRQHVHTAQCGGINFAANAQNFPNVSAACRRLLSRSTRRQTRRHYNNKKTPIDFLHVARNCLQSFWRAKQCNYSRCAPVFTHHRTIRGVAVVAVVISSFAPDIVRGTIILFAPALWTPSVKVRAQSLRLTPPGRPGARSPC